MVLAYLLIECLSCWIVFGQVPIRGQYRKSSFFKGGIVAQSVGSNSSPKASTGSLGTFGGVFTPSVLTILGIILFLRLGYVVGSAGLTRALIIIGLANAISVLTSISLSAIATNLKVKGGGDYYLISRTLGLEFGGAIGIVLFLAQSVSIAFYCIGFGEAMSALVSEGGRWLPQIIAARMELTYHFMPTVSSSLTVQAVH